MPAARAAGGQDDADHDGIGDECDPNPGTPGDVLVRFDAFQVASDALPSDWTDVTGTDASWTVSGDALQYPGEDDSAAILFDTGSPHHTISIDLDIGATGDGGGGIIIGGLTVGAEALTDSDTELDSLVLCELRNDTDGNTTGSFLFRGNTLEDQSGAFVPAEGQRYLVVSRSGSGQQCAQRLAGGSAIALRGSGQAAGNTQVGLRMRNLAASIRSIAIYTSP